MPRGIKNKTRALAKTRSPAGRRPDAWDERRERQEFQENLRLCLLALFARSNIPERGRGPWLASITHRSKQAAARWLKAGSEGGLPDVIALRQIALAFDADPAYLMGLTRFVGRARGVETAGAPALESFLQELSEEFAKVSKRVQAWRVDGDEMEPRIQRGAVLFVDLDANTLSSSGLYAFDAAGAMKVRMVETKLGGGISLKCANPNYSELSLAKVSDLKRQRISVLGRVTGWIELRSA